VAPTATFVHEAFIQFAAILDPLCELASCRLAASVTCARGMVEQFVLKLAEVYHALSAAVEPFFPWAASQLGQAWQAALAAAAFAHKLFKPLVLSIPSRLASAWSCIVRANRAHGEFDIPDLNFVVSPAISWLKSGRMLAEASSALRACGALASGLASWQMRLMQRSVAGPVHHASWLLAPLALGANSVAATMTSWLEVAWLGMVAAASHAQVSCAPLVSATASWLPVVWQNVATACSAQVSTLALMLNQLSVPLAENRALGISVFLLLFGLTVYGPRQLALRQHAKTILVLESLTEGSRFRFMPQAEVVNSPANTVAQLVMEVGKKQDEKGPIWPFNTATKELGSAVFEFGKAALARSECRDACEIAVIEQMSAAKSRVDSALCQLGNFSSQVSEAAKEISVQGEAWRSDAIRALEALERAPLEMQRELLKMRFKPLKDELKILGLDDMLPENIDGPIIEKSFQKMIDVTHPELAVDRQLQKSNKTQYDIERKYYDEKQEAVTLAYRKVKEAWDKSSFLTS